MSAFRSLFGGLLAAAAVLLTAPAWAASYQLNINTALTTDDPIYKGLEQLRDRVAERSEGALQIRIFPGSQLGRDEDVLEQARAGANVAVVVDGGRLAVFVKEFGILGAPYLASGFEGVRRVVTAPLFEEWVERLREASGHQVLSFNWWQGERHLLTKMPVSGPEDLAGQRMRTPGAPVWMETIRAMGATPTPMGWSEVYPALQQGVIDAVEAQVPAAHGSRLYEVTSHLTRTGHINLITGIVTSAAWFDGLPGEIQAILREESLAAGDAASRMTEAAIGVLEAEMQAQGMTITDIDTTPFRERTAEVYERLDYLALRAQVEEQLRD